MRVCKRCDTEKPAAEFNRSPAAAARLHTYCRSCQSEYARLRRNEAARIREFEEYLQMIEAQGARCAICGAEETQAAPSGGVRFLSVDHCHGTGKVRALLCAQCNRGLGHFRDDPERMRAAAQYVEKYAEKHSEF